MRSPEASAVAFFLVAVLTFLLNSPLIGSGQVPETGFGVVARQHIDKLSEGLGARVAGSREEARAATYIEGVGALRHLRLSHAGHRVAD